MTSNPNTQPTQGMTALDEFFRDYSYMFCTFTEGKNYDRKCIYCGDYKEADIHILKGDIEKLVDQATKEAVLKYRFNGMSDESIKKFITDLHSEEERRVNTKEEE